MTIQELRERQQWTLAQKIDHSLGVIDQFQSHFNGQVYVSFSGGKDSVVMRSLVRLVLPDVKSVFVMTGCESPSVCRFIRQMRADGEDIDIIRPQKTFKQVIEECGFPLVSKQVSSYVAQVRRNPTCQSAINKMKDGSTFAIPKRWRYLITEPYDVSDRCCFWLKHQPTKAYERSTGRHPYIGTLAAESRARTYGYLQQGGCNFFTETGKNHPRSLPLAIWTDDDVWQYIRDRQLQLPDIYQQGERRTGCMGCAFGAHLDPHRFDVMRRLWPRWYEQTMNYENHGIRYGDAIQRAIENIHGDNQSL